MTQDAQGRVKTTDTLVITGRHHLSSLVSEWFQDASAEEARSRWGIALILIAPGEGDELTFEAALRFAFNDMSGTPGEVRQRAEHAWRRLQNAHNDEFGIVLTWDDAARARLAELDHALDEVDPSVDQSVLDAQAVEAIMFETLRAFAADSRQPVTVGHLRRIIAGEKGNDPKWAAITTFVLLSTHAV